MLNEIKPVMSLATRFPNLFYFNNHNAKQRREDQDECVAAHLAGSKREKKCMF